MLALVLLLTQLHCCEPQFVRPSGETCAECSTIVEQSKSSVLASDTHGDCHDCCEIRECKTPKTADSLSLASNVAFEFAALPSRVVLPELGFIPRVWEQFVFRASAPPTGPPSSHLSRGPPQILAFSHQLDARSRVA